jgi:hypothetical protein
MMKIAASFSRLRTGYFKWYGLSGTVAVVSGHERARREVSRMSEENE